MRIVPIKSLRKGRVFTLNGEKFKLLYLNECRAYVQSRVGEKVSVKGHNFRKSQPVNISCGTLVEVDEGLI